MSELAAGAFTPTLASRPDRDLLQALLADKRSPYTRRAYRRDLYDFFRTMAGADPNPQLVAEFLRLDRYSALSVVLEYKAHLQDRGLAEATINRRLAAIKSLVNYARQIGRCDYSLQDITGERVRPYRDTAGISAEAFRAMLAVPDSRTLKGKRDRALLLVLWGNALRRGELARTNIADWDRAAATLRIYGKGEGKQAQTVSLGAQAQAALAAWIDVRGEAEGRAPLFCSTHRGYWGRRLSTTSLYQIVRRAATAAGIDRPLGPHQIRHSAITAALDRTGGDVRKVQKLSRHAKLETLSIYDQGRLNAQQTVTELLDELV
ncbi:MAG: integrase [Cyanobacteria bacterium QS_8_64_29]|nr:MAG: integrase [Cyanobacteria bacterium QS_8_64_29]